MTEDEDTGRVTRQFYREPRQGSINRLAFTRDAYLGLVPIRVHASEIEFAAKLRADNEREAEIVRLLARDSTHYDLTEVVCGFVEEVAEVLTAYGEAAYEVVTRTTPDDSHALAAPSTDEQSDRGLELVPPLSLHGIGPLILQVAPPTNGRKRPDILRVPADRIWRIRLPRSLGGARGHRRMLRQLDRLERRGRRFTLNLMNPPVGYDFTAAQRAIKAAEIRTTRRWGVTGLSTQGMTDYYTVAGHIENSRVQALLRDHIVASVNALLARLGLPSFDFEGLPTQADIASTLARLEAGEIDFATANKLTRMH
jgi:hypothetical protein